MQSILQTEKTCLVCGRTTDIHRHHVFMGNKQKSLSEKYGLTVNLCGYHHDMSDAGIHFNKELRVSVQSWAQKKFEETYPDLNFLQIFGRNYI